ncbi:MAG: hypothetical protein ACI8UO_004377 [Verrucomicrobiales bacterium]|jgi:hypothetical protein
MFPPWKSLFAFAAALVFWGQAAWADFVPVRGGELKIDLVVGEVRASVTASGFYEPQRSADQPREMFATKIQATVGGKAEATFKTTPIGEGEERSWLRKVEVAAEFDQSVDVQIDPEKLEAADDASEDFRWNLAASESPVRIRFIPRSISPPARPRCEIRIDIGEIAERAGIAVSRTSGSKITETVLNHTLKEGAVVDLATPPNSREIFEPIRIEIGVEGGAAVLEHDRQVLAPLRFSDSSVRYVDQLTESRILFFGVESFESKPIPNPDLTGGFGVTPVRLTWEFTAGAPLDLGWIEPVQSDGETWLPEFGATRKFTIRLKEPGEVEAVRFVLDLVSQHPGIAINANEAAAIPAARKLEPAPVQVAAGPVQWTRFYQRYQNTNLDSGPDLAFELERNSAFKLEENRSIALATNPSREQTAIVTAFDWAASGVVRGQVQIGGVWEDLPAKGATAAGDKISLQIPLDANGDRIGDAWALGSGEDDGDGISALDEYRGAYVNGKHRRLSPTQLDAFALDYTTRSGAELGGLSEVVSDDVVLHIINGAEHQAELVGNSQLVVLEELRENALPSLLRTESQEAAWAALAPSASFRTLFLDGEPNQQLLARDLRRIFDLKPGVEVAEKP